MYTNTIPYMRYPGEAGSWNQPPADPEGQLLPCREFLDDSVLSSTGSLMCFRFPWSTDLTQAVGFPIDLGNGIPAVQCHHHLEFVTLFNCRNPDVQLSITVSLAFISLAPFGQC